MTNSEIVERLEDAMALMDLMEFNPFKINSFRTVAQLIEKLPAQLQTMEPVERTGHFSKTMSANIEALLETATFPELSELEAQVPIGVRNLFLINGIGPKKIRVLWKEAGIESTAALKEACLTGQVSQLKGFGQKIQQTILDGISYLESIQGKLLMHKADEMAQNLKNEMAIAGIQSVEVVGDVVFKAELVSSVQFLLPKSEYARTKIWIENQPEIQFEEAKSNPWMLKAFYIPTGTPIQFHFARTEDWAKRRYLLNSDSPHWTLAKQAGVPLYKTWLNGQYNSDDTFFNLLGKKAVPVDVRVGCWEWAENSGEKQENLIDYQHLKGCIHNHSRYSDGKNTIREMADYCMDQGWEYFGIADHSKTAVYAQGLWEEKVILQWKEIDELNSQLTPFRILKGIESDILADGSLDYEEDILKGFDYVVASVHSGLKMDKETATARLIRAIENPYTRILGHCSGRILLRREGYPLHYQKIIDACIANKVAIEINAHPSRLDMDWTQLAKALDQGAFISINPDAHEVNGMDLMRYGTYMARKAGASQMQVINAFSLAEILQFFQK